MFHLELTNEELSTLKEMMENDIVSLRLEVSRTDKREFRKMLDHKEQILEKILSMLKE